MRNACGVFDYWKRNYAILAPLATWTACSTLSQRSSLTAITRLFDEWKMSKLIRVDVRVILQIPSYILLLFKLITANSIMYLSLINQSILNKTKTKKEFRIANFKFTKQCLSNKLFQKKNLLVKNIFQFCLQCLYGTFIMRYHSGIKKIVVIVIGFHNNYY